MCLQYLSQKTPNKQKRSAPKLYGLAKVHKAGIPVRPVVSYNPSEHKSIIVTDNMRSLIRTGVPFNFTMVLIELC